jgi:LEA14-like dessication related protein
LKIRRQFPAECQQIIFNANKFTFSLTHFNRKWPDTLIDLQNKSKSMKKLIPTLIIMSGLALASCSTANVKEPEYRDISNIRLLDVGLLQSTAGVDFVFYNPNNFGVSITEARGDLYIDNTYFGRFELSDKVQVGRNSEFIIPAVVKLDMIGAVKNGRDLLKKKEALIRIDGRARVKKAGISKDIAINYESMENIERFRGLVSR